MTSFPLGNPSDADAARRGAHEVELRTDAPSRTPALIAALGARGFTRIKLTTIAASDALTAMFAVAPGPLAANEVDAAELIVATDAFARENAINRGRYPIQRLATDESSPVITLPLEACSTGARPSYAGIDPDRFLVRIESDDRARSQAVVDALLKQGYRAIRRAIQSDAVGFSITSPTGEDAIAFIEPIRLEMERAIKEVAGDAEAEFGIDLNQTDTKVVTAVLPLAAAASGALVEKMSAPDRYSCIVYCADTDSEAVKRLERRLSGLGWASLSIKRPESISGPRIAYGGAPSPLLQRVQDIVAETLRGPRLRLDRRWSKRDTDVWIYLPPESTLDVATAKLDALTAVAAPTSVASTDRSFVAVHDTHVAIGRHVLPRHGRHPLAPDPTDYAHYVIDQPTAENLDHIAASVLAAEPCLIEGATATSKTSAMLFLASLLGQGVMRLNLNGQTDASELIGRFKPSGEKTWCWSPGAVPRAMREGLWLVLDELNLCESNVIERLNSVLEMSPSLYLGEFDYSVIGGSGGDPTHPGFRVMASLNPVEGHVGRSPLSPALRDRFVGYRRSRRADANDICGQLRFLLCGEEPAVVIDGMRYAGRMLEGRAVHHDLAQQLPDLDRLITALARFHVGAEAACEAQGWAVDRPVITRRALLACLGHLDSHRAATPQEWPARLWGAIERYYLGRAFDPNLRASLVALATATGIRPDRWGFS